MKKIRVNLKRSAKKCWTFVLYDSVESAFCMREDGAFGEGIVDEECRREVKLMPGETLEAEWIGSEWVYNDEAESDAKLPSSLKHEKYDQVLVGKLTQTIKGVDPKSPGGYLEVYVGWVLSGNIPWVQDDTQDNVRITQIKGKVRSKFDFSKIFEESNLDIWEEGDEYQKPLAPTVLN